MIHPTAIIDPGAELGSDVDIGPYAIVRERVSIGSGTIIGPHAVIEPYVTIGPDCHIFQFASIGAVPQSVSFEGGETWVRIGRGTIIREFATIHRGTDFGGGITQVGEDCFLMAYSHVAHDCKVGRNVTMANNATLGGHVSLGDYASVGGLAAAHQFVKIGDHAFIGGASVVVKDVPPYMMAVGNRATLHGLNTVGLKRRGMSQKSLSALKKAYRIIFRSKIQLSQAMEQVHAEVDQVPEILNLINFINASERGIIR